MAADVDHLGHDASTDIVGLLWVVSYVEIHGVMYQTIGNAFLPRLGRASPLESDPSVQQPRCQIGRCVLLSGRGHHGGDVWQRWQQMGGRGTGGDDSYKTKFAHQTMMALAAVLRPPWGPTPGFYAYNNQQTYYGTGLPS